MGKINRKIQNILFTHVNTQINIQRITNEINAYRQTHFRNKIKKVFFITTAFIATKFNKI